MTQSALSGERFSKEYLSQIERGKTRPTSDTLDWLARRLGVDAGYLANGVSDDQRARLETALTRADVLTESERFGDALAAFEELGAAVAATASPELAVRALTGEAKARVLAGEVREALDLLTQARGLVEDERFSDVERAEVLFRIGVCRYKLSSVATAVTLLNEALSLAESSGLPCDHLRSNILHWRSRCYRRQRDYEAAREDVERALELAEGLSDARTVGHLYFQASVLAEREGHLVLARSYAERARGLYEELSDRANVGKLLNNLGGLSFLLGKPEQAISHLKDAFGTAIEIGSDPDAAQAISSLAQVHLRTGRIDLAEEQARQALALLEGRVDFLDEIGSAQLVLGRALLEQGRLDEAEAAFAAAEQSLEQLSSASHRAAAWIARGDLSSRRGDDREAARLYRRAAEALADIGF
ncbi:MAG: tetratricopeptide repeat protein [Actinobacteria bacterium]|nr:tetratricopeptide repeat protein [Actinomycetota bacterium]